MKKILQYIQSCNEKYEFEVLDNRLIKKIEYEINEFVRNNYPKIHSRDYVELFMDDNGFTYKVKIQKELEDELNNHYPESFI